MSFHEIRFPARLSFGSTGGPEWLTEIVTLANGHEERNSPWSQSRRRYEAGVGVRSLDDVATLIAFFEARGGRLHAFRWRDWADYKSCRPSAQARFDDQVLGTGDGARRAFQLVKQYRSGGQVHERVIRKPVADSVRAGVAGVKLDEGADWTVDLTTGLVTFAVAPASGAPVTAGFEFDVPVRFDADAIRCSAAGFEAGEVPDVPVVEVRL